MESSTPLKSVGCGVVATLVTMGALAALFILPAPTAYARESGWKVTRQDENPRVYAVTEPSASNLNVKLVVLSCEEVDNQKALQLQIYPSNRGPLLPVGSKRNQMKEDPRAEIVIDGHTYPVTLSFGGQYALLHDREEELLPVLSSTLLQAMETGHTMLLRFDIVGEAVGQPPEFDGELRIDLVAGQGGEAVAAVRRGCAK